MKNIIWCEVTCGKCGATAHFNGFYSPEQIKRLKCETKNWDEDEQYGTLCPECLIQVKKERKH